MIFAYRLPIQVPEAAEAEEGDGERVFASTELARKVFSRRPLSKEQKTIISILGKAYPNWVPAADVQKATGYSPAQFAGLMGAWGRRLTHTQGWADGVWLFDQEWNYDTKAYDYRLPDTVFEAAKAEKLI